MQQQGQNISETLNQHRVIDEKSWKILERTVQASIIEQRRTRRWGIFFKLLMFGYLLFMLLALSPLASLNDEAKTATGPHTALVEVRGMIAEQETASADRLVTALRKAFESSNTKAVVLRINSPGGSPVQSGYVYDEIKRLKATKPEIKVYAVITDLGASGAYYIASAADEIYADTASLVGSIGVTAASFGFVGAMEKLGVERRVYTSGEHKAFLDPFQPAKADEAEFWRSVLDTTHKQFIKSVKDGRGDRLKDKEHPELFSGLIWSGEQALELGLIDKLGNTSYVAREVIGVENIVDFTVQDTPFDRLAKRFGASAASSMATWLGLEAPRLQ